MSYVVALKANQSLPSIWALRLNASPGKVSLKRKSGQTMNIDYYLNERNSLGFLGLGIGPYYGEFNGEGQQDIGWSTLLSGYNMSLGGFIYPEINGRSYYNLWWRWGGKIFGEINYLAAKETFDNQSVSSKSLGVTFGFPVARFW